MSKLKYQSKVNGFHLGRETGCPQNSVIKIGNESNMKQRDIDSNSYIYVEWTEKSENFHSKLNKNKSHSCKLS